MKKIAVLLSIVLMMGWTNLAYAQGTGGQTGNRMLLFLALIAIHCLLLFVASKIADFEQPDFWRAVSCSLGIGAILFLTLVFTGKNDIQQLPIIALIIVAAIAIVLIQRVYNTTIGKTLIAFAISFIATIIAARMLSGVL